MVASSQPLATLSGYKAMNKGGNAIDAAVAMVSTLSVVEPHSVGIGGDAFALVYLPCTPGRTSQNAMVIWDLANFWKMP
jgi:gamma-glutamyltranspeptidase